MERVLIDTKEKFIEFLKACGISEQILYHAFKMDLNIPKLFYDKIVNNYSEKSLDEVTKNLLGVFGNYIATIYYKARFKNVQNEVPIKDEFGNTITKADIAFVDNEKKQNYCEVKAVSQIIDNIRNYVDKDASSGKYFVDKDNEIIKYKNIGKKLITQVRKLSKTNARVTVAIFKGCIMDEIIKQHLSELKVRIHTIAMDINELEDEIKQMISLIHEFIKTNITISFIPEEKRTRKHKSR